jgi:hypothetical protein
MLDNDVGPGFMIILGLVFATYGLGQLVQAYRLEQLDEWAAKVLPGAGAVMLGALFAWSGYRLGADTAAAAALHASRVMGAAFITR